MNDGNLSTTYEKLMNVIADYNLNQTVERTLDFFNLKVTHRQYGLGGECLHRGYYCPSKIYDIVVGNVNRGIITKQKPVDRAPNFVFGFDSQNKLILVEQPGLSEIIYYKESFEIGIAISDDMKIQSLSECRFFGEKIKSYNYYLLDPYEKKVVERNEENYTYFKNQVQVDWSRSTVIDKTLVQQHEKYTFSIEDGYLASYSVQDLNGLEKTACNNRLFKVRLKRKI